MAAAALLLMLQGERERIESDTLTDEELKKRRYSRETFLYILEISEGIEKETVRNHSISADKQLLLALSF